MDTIKFNKLNVKMVAHAGLSGREMNNTCAGFVAAGNRSYWGIECDVRAAKDGFVVIHNATSETVSPTNISIADPMPNKTIPPESQENMNGNSDISICAATTSVLL